MQEQAKWRTEMGLVVDLMRDLSQLTDPQEAALLYGQRLRSDGLIPATEYVAVSRRGLAAPEYRITRNSRWKAPINPWTQTERLPKFDRGMLGDLLYSNQPAVICDLPAKLARDDPAYNMLSGFELMVTLPQFELGESLNMGVMLARESKGFPFDRVPVMIWQSNLWGRAVHQLVLRNELAAAFESLQLAHAGLDREMASVGIVQRSLLPESPPRIAGVEIAAHYQTSQRAGGDYYDFFPQPNNRQGILMADVSGHGAAAAVLMAATHALAQLHPGAGMPPSQMLEFLNQHLVKRYTSSGSFVTAFYGIFDPGSRRLVYSTAGHPPPRVVRDGQVLPCADSDAAGLPLGIEEDLHYSQAIMQLKADDRLMIYTDGIPEARNAAGDLFGYERMDQTLARSRGSAAEMMATLLDAVAEFSGTRAPDDDRTIVMIAL